MRTSLFRRHGLVALLAAGVLASACGNDIPAATNSSGPATTAGGASTAPPEAVEEAMSAPMFEHTSWGILVEDAETGEVLLDERSGEVFEAGSVTKLFSASAALDRYGADARFTTPVYRTGPVADGTLEGDLVLVASGDQNLGGRGVLDGPIQYLPTDHTYPQLPGAAITPGDPLAGLRSLATQVAASGVRSVRGDVVIDDRLFETWTGWEDRPISPIVLNDNEIDVLSTPTEVGGPAELTWRPQVPGWEVRSEVTTVAASEGRGTTVALEGPGRLVVTGTVEAGAQPELAGWFVEDPAAFARAAFIAELEAAGVDVTADATGPNPATDLPAKGSYEEADRVAALESAPLSETVTLVLKVSHNRGAQLLACMVAVADGSTSCQDGLAGEYELAERAGIDRDELYVLDGAGSSLSRFSPHAVVQLVEWATTQPWGGILRDALPVLGESGDLDLFGGTPADGKVATKTGTRAIPDPGAGRLLVQTRAMAGFVEGASGRELHVGIFAQNMPAASIEDVLVVAKGVVEVAVAIQQSY